MDEPFAVSLERWRQVQEEFAFDREKKFPDRHGRFVEWDDILSKVHVGKSVLDVGCGRQILRRHLPEGTSYTGLDPFPCEGFKDKTVACPIEIDGAKDDSYDTVFACAVLDHVYDLPMALSSIARIAKENVVICTCLNDQPPADHTVAVTREVICGILERKFNLTVDEPWQSARLMEFTRK